MKMTLKDRIALSLEIFSNSDFQDCIMNLNDEAVVFHASAMVGSGLIKRDNHILMNRNAVPNRWFSDPNRSGYKINSAFKDACAKIVEYLQCVYNITPGRVLKLLDILSRGIDGYSQVGRDLKRDEALQRYFRNLNNLRMHCEEMTKSEIYDFSFDMVYEFLDKVSLSKKTLSLSLLIMYWIQRECDLIPLAVACSEDDFLAALETQYGDTRTERERKREFRLFMRKLLDLHLKKFIRNETKNNEKKITSRDRILELIKDNPTHTAKTMASCLGLSVQGVQKQIAILKLEKRLKRIGPDNGGSWQFLEK